MLDLGHILAQQPPAFIYILSVPSNVDIIIIPVKRRRKRWGLQVKTFQKTSAPQPSLGWDANAIIDNLHNPNYPSGQTDTLTSRVILQSANDEMWGKKWEESLLTLYLRVVHYIIKGLLLCTSKVKKGLSFQPKESNWHESQPLIYNFILKQTRWKLERHT